MGEKIYTLGRDEQGKLYGIYASDRVHIAIFGFPGTGKSTLMLHLILQNIRNGEGVLVLDPHGDLVAKLLTHIPKHLWNKVIYIDPMTAFKFGRVVQLNFLEYKNELEKDLVARTFMDSLAKIYTRFWGPRLDMIMLNAIYALLEAGQPTISDVYRVIAEEDYREGILARVRDPKVRSFWESEFKRMPKDASASVLTKIYRIVQEKILQPMFESAKSSIDFRKVMDEGKIVIINLAEGKLTSDVVNFLGSLILARIYLAGMSRVDVPEHQRRPFYVYVDEAHRFMTSSIKDMLEALRKYHVYSTIAAQHLEQYREDIGLAIPSLCSTIICFATGKETANKLEGFFKPVITAEDIQNLPQYWMVVSTLVKGVRECMSLQVIDEGFGPFNPEDIIRRSLEIYGNPVLVERPTPVKEEIKEIIDYPDITPAMWLILVTLKIKGKMEREEIVETLEKEWGIQITATRDALSALVMRNYVLVNRQVTRKTEKIPLPDGSVKYRQIKKVLYYYKISPLANRLYFADIPVSPRAGGDEHLSILATILTDLRSEGYFCFPDLGGEGVKKKPDIIVYPLEKRETESGREVVNPKMWNTPRIFAVEVETDPMSYKDRLLNNWKKCKNLGMPVIFVVKSYREKIATEEFLKANGVPIVNSIMEQYAPGNAQVIFVTPGVRVALPELLAERESKEGGELPEEEVIEEEIAAEAEEFVLTPKLAETEEKIKKLLEEGYKFRKKKVKGRIYVVARKKKSETSLGALTPELQKLLERHNIFLK